MKKTLLEKVKKNLLEKQILLVTIISIVFLGFMLILLLKFKEHLDSIPNEIKKLKL